MMTISNVDMMTKWVRQKLKPAEQLAFKNRKGQHICHNTM